MAREFLISEALRRAMGGVPFDYVGDSDADLPLVNAADGVFLVEPSGRLLWLACPVLMYWLTRYWFLAHRRETHDDPVVFALKDGRSLLAGLATALIVAAASLRI